jgi:hypothetical protein
VLRLCLAGGNPRQDLLYILIRKILQTSIGRPSGVMLPQNIRYRIRVDL